MGFENMVMYLAVMPSYDTEKEKKDSAEAPKERQNSYKNLNFGQFMSIMKNYKK